MGNQCAACKNCGGGEDKIEFNDVEEPEGQVNKKDEQFVLPTKYRNA
jgi:hypothetical protein